MTTGTASVTIDGYTFTVTVTKTPVVTAGVQAARIADLLEPFGVNTFSSLSADANLWGTYPSDYSPSTVIAAMNWLTAGSGLTMRGREYHYAGRETMQAPWLQQVAAATGAKFSLCVGANGSAADVPSMLALAANPANNIAWLEGSNEPNNDFGSGVLPTATTLAVQAGLGASAVGPSVVFGLPFPENWISPGYFGTTDLTQLKIAFANGHSYAPRNPDLDDGSNRGGAFDDVARGLNTVYGGKPLMITEWHPTLFNSDGQSANDALAAYFAPLTLLSAHRLGVQGMWWFSLFDYGSTYRSGLFPVNATNPRPAAYAIRAMYALTGDHGATKRTFTPGKLNYTVSGLQPPINAASPHTGGQHDLFQASDGRFFIPLRNSQASPGGPKAPVTVTFDRAMPVKEYNISLGTAASMTAIQSVNASSLVSQLDGSVRLLVIG